MHHTTNASQSQDTIQINSQIDAFFKSFTIGTLMDRAGIQKRHGYRVCSLIKTICTLPFIGKNFFRGIVINKDVDFGKDAAYQVLKCSRYNWRKLVLALAVSAGALEVSSAWAAVRLENEYQSERWGRDMEADAHAARLQGEFEVAARFLALHRAG